jgi:catechol 2,3-dioxygenase-like lactoylglutathione lyase family enzyme
LERQRSRVSARSIALGANPSPEFDASAFGVADPDGNVTVFGVRARDPASGTVALPGRLQHVALRTPKLDEMAAFYEHGLGFVVSDRVLDEHGVLRACFLRTDAEHHVLALFGASEAQLDHHSYETRDWAHIRRWADHFSAHRMPIFWGVGRHGPGNDVFFMVKDPDDNLVEISAELEVCAADRPVGVWPHEQRTLNLWGSAIMRS